MSCVNITVDNLKDLLKEAYFQGWTGCLELQDSVVNSIVDKWNSLNESVTVSVDSSSISFGQISTDRQITLNTQQYSTPYSITPSQDLLAFRNSSGYAINNYPTSFQYNYGTT